MSFQIPDVEINGNGWGPQVVEKTDVNVGSIPFAPFNKSDRIGKVSDFITSKYYMKANRTKYFGAGSTSQFAYSHEIKEKEFNLVQGEQKSKKRKGGRKFNNYNNRNRNQNRGRNNNRGYQNNKYGNRKRNSKSIVSYNIVYDNYDDFFLI